MEEASDRRGDDHAEPIEMAQVPAHQEPENKPSLRPEVLALAAALQDLGSRGVQKFVGTFVVIPFVI